MVWIKKINELLTWIKIEERFTEEEFNALKELSKEVQKICKDI